MRAEVHAGYKALVLVESKKRPRQASKTATVSSRHCAHRVSLHHHILYSPSTVFGAFNNKWRTAQAQSSVQYVQTNCNAPQLHVHTRVRVDIFDELALNRQAGNETGRGCCSQFRRSIAWERRMHVNRTCTDTQQPPTRQRKRRNLKGTGGWKHNVSPHTSTALFEGLGQTQTTQSGLVRCVSKCVYLKMAATVTMSMYEI
jgi:hypothetical protein